jgi:molybdopterin converting factor subunit 1
MRIIVKLFAIVREKLGVSEVAIELRQGQTVADLRRQLSESYGDAAPVLGKCAVAVNRVYANAETVLHEGDEVAVIPPVSGGC